MLKKEGATLHNYTSSFILPVLVHLLCQQLRQLSQKCTNRKWLKNLENRGLWLFARVLFFLSKSEWFIKFCCFRYDIQKKLTTKRIGCKMVKNYALINAKKSLFYKEKWHYWNPFRCQICLKIMKIINIQKKCIMWINIVGKRKMKLCLSIHELRFILDHNI